MFESLTDIVSGSPWTYAFIIGISALDVVFPLVPSETSVILAGVLASSGDLILILVIVSAAFGAFAGDNTSYWVGRTAGERLAERFFKGERRKRLDWAEQQVNERGGYLIVVGRFIPGGRTAVTLASGTLEMPWPKFIFFDTVAAIFWASYAALLGYFGGKAFEEAPWKGFVIAFFVAMLIAGGVEAFRWLRKRRELAGG